MNKELENAWAVQEIWQDKCYKLEEENKKLKESLDIATKCSSKEEDGIIRLSEENKKLKEFKAKQEEMIFLIGASIELAEPKTYRDAEKLQKGKEIYEKLYKEELYSLREENKKLKEDFDNYKNKVSEDMKEIVKNQTENIKLFDRIKGEYKKLEEENKKLKEELDKFSDAYKIYRDYEKEELAESCYDFARENDELKKKLESLEK